MQSELYSSTYGKGNVKFLKVKKDTSNPTVQDVLEANVQVLLRGKFDESYTKADNSSIVPTDTVKNTILIEAKTSDVWPIERFAAHLAKHFTTKYSHVEGVEVTIVQTKWTKIKLNGKDHAHSFKHDGPETRRTFLDYDKLTKKLQVTSSIKDLTVLKSTGSMFYGYNVCDYTTLQPTKDRILSTDVDASWTFDPTKISTLDDVLSHPELFDFAYNSARDVTLELFCLENSASVQATMYNMSHKILETVKEIGTVNIILSVIATAAITVGLVETYHAYEKSKQSKPTSSPQPQVQPQQVIKKREHSEELIREQLARNYAFLTEPGMEKVRSQRIVVVGAGGVGSWVATMLARSGVEHLRIIDFDQVSLSSLNRHAVATLKDVGISKVDCIKNHLLEIAPWIDIDARNQLWNLESAEELIYGDDFKPTYVVDCIDNLDTKCDLLTYCHEKKIPIVSSGGAATKSDPTRINLADISKTEEDPLMKKIRVVLKKRGIVQGIPVIFSAEKPDPRKAKLLPLPDDEFAKGNVDQLSALRDFRVRILPVLGTMPGMFGLAIATFILTTVSGYPVEPVEGKNRYKVYDDLLQSLAGQQTRIGRTDQRVQIAMHEVNYLLEDVFRGKSPISNYSTRLTLSRWDPKKELSLQNVVIMTKDEQRNHENRVLNGGEALEDVYSKEVLDLIQKRFADEAYFSQFK
ncbi:putative mitochondrial outer membrane protein [Candida maltosa Xu316]|uniref:factor independent urate hydroxylase n=1 Tax=Candida maltosa (strain Xu316) TaxID=1245528 RepID=M3JCY2_CANMX|nr:putative mitochondrial outer membrane protein [Candida maltosa Xu316]